MKFNKIDIISKFTLTFGITGIVTTCIGVGANIAGITTIATSHFNNTTTFDSCTEKALYFGNILMGSGLIVVGTSIGIAKYVGESLSDEYFGGRTTFTPEQEKYLSKTHKCNQCKYFHGHQYNGIDLVCAIHPTGKEGDDCPDQEIV